MYIIAGLGNPGKEYQNTRHNAGFEVIDLLAERYGIRVIEKKHDALIGKGTIDGVKCVLVKPLTYMNLSGRSIRSVLDFYKADPTSEVIVICDDIAQMPGNLRVRKKGSAGGHNGLKDIIAHLGTDEFIRVRVGVGEKPVGGDLVKHVLGHYNAEDRKRMNESEALAADAVRTILTSDVDAAMNQFNRKNV